MSEIKAPCKQSGYILIWVVIVINCIGLEIFTQSCELQTLKNIITSDNYQ